MLEWWTKNFASCQLGDERLNNRAFSIGKTLSQGFGKAFSEIFSGAKELKSGATPRYAERYPLGRRKTQGNAHQERAYEFLLTRRQILAR